MAYEWSRLGERPFENLCRALAVHVLGPGLQAFGDGPDGGREASFDGPARFAPALGGPWNGYGVLQAKYRRSGTETRAAEWLRRQIAAELDRWADSSSKRVADGRLPEYLIIATNVRLSSAARTGGIDRIRTLLTGYAERLNLKGWALWDANQLSTYLDAYPEVSARFAEFLTPGDVLAKTIATLDGLVANAARMPRIRVGQGQPGNERSFQAAYEAAGGEAVLGEPTSEVFDEGPGWIQHFAGGPGHGPAVICARFGQAPVAVDARVWDAVRSASPKQLADVGYPVVKADGPALIDAETAQVDLDRGTWGAGHLRRDSAADWRREPEISFTFETRARDYWSHPASPMDLRLRCAALSQWANIVDRAIDGAGRSRVLHALSGSPLVELLAMFAARLGPDASTARWERTPDDEGHNDRRFLAYRQVVCDSAGRQMLGLWARFQLPDGLRSSVVSLVDLRVNLAREPTAPGESRVELGLRPDGADLASFFAAAWTAAVHVLPLAATPEPLAIRPNGPTVIEMHLDSERANSLGGGHRYSLLDLLNLDDWGQPPSQPLRRMSAAVMAPPALDAKRVGSLTVQAMHHLASGFGFLDIETE